MFLVSFFLEMAYTTFGRMISLKEAMDLTRKKELNGRLVPFDLVFVTFNRKKNKGGQIIRLQNCVRVSLSHNMKANGTMGVKQLDSDNHVYAVHPRLIVEFNHEKVFY
jgi:hypothetical protein